MKRRNIAKATGLFLLVGIGLFSASSAFATFIVDATPTGEMFFNGDAQSDVSTFTGTVGGQHSGPPVTVTTVGPVDTGAGFSTIKPAQHQSQPLTSITFTPFDANLFTDFSFRGQLNADAGGTVELIVQDNQGNAPQTFFFTGLGANADFARIGIIALAGSGETIQSITLMSDFKEEKQNLFSFPGETVPDAGSTMTMLGMATAGLGLFRWKMTSKK